MRGKTGRVYGDLIAMLTALKGLPLAYNKDMQEDKEAVFDAVDTVKMCLRVMAPMLATMTVRADKMLHAAQTGFLNATDLADYLVTKGLPFRSAYKVSGQLVAYCIAHNTVLEKLPLETFRTFSDLFDDGVYASRGACPTAARPCRASRRRSPGSRSSSRHKHIRIFFTRPALPFGSAGLALHKKILYNKQKVVQKGLPFPGWGWYSFSYPLC